MEAGHPLPLWRILGFLPRWGAAPCARSAQWGAVVARLRKAMPPGVKLPRMGSWPILWALVHATPPLAQTTWERLCGEASVDTIVDRLRAGAAAPPYSCYSWNARWVKASTLKAALKRQPVLDSTCGAGRLRLGDAAVRIARVHVGRPFPGLPSGFRSRSHRFPRRHVAVFVPLRAVFVPHRTRIVSQCVLAPGCAVECCIDYGEEGTRAFWSVYLPPGAQGSTLDLLWGASPPEGSAIVTAGDFNIEIARLRNEEEAGLGDKLGAWFGRLGVTPVPGSGHTRCGRSGNACIDAIAVRTQWAGLEVARRQDMEGRPLRPHPVADRRRKKSVGEQVLRPGCHAFLPRRGIGRLSEGHHPRELRLGNSRTRPPRRSDLRPCCVKPPSGTRGFPRAAPHNQHCVRG